MAKPQYGWSHQRARKLALESLVDGTACIRCGRPMRRAQSLDLDHLIAVANGGVNGPTALVHSACNRSAGGRLGNRRRAMRRRRNGRTSNSNRDRNGGDGQSLMGRQLPRW